MTPRLLLEAEAEEEFREAVRWYEARREGLGGEFGRAVAATLGDIQAAPARFPVALRDIRKARVARFPYVVYFVPMGEVIAVVAVMHGRRDPHRWQARR